MKRTLAAFLAAATFSVCVCAQTPPPNDLCINAIPVFNGTNPSPPIGVSGSTYTNVGAGTETVTSCAASTPSVSDVWFSYTATATGTALVHTCVPPGFVHPGGVPQWSLAVYTACGGVELACAKIAACAGGLTGVPVTAGTSYILRIAGVVPVAGNPSTTGSFYLTIVAPTTAPNDLCAAATPVLNGVNPAPPLGASGNRFSTAGTGTEGTAPCVPFPTFNDVFFSYTATATGVAVFSTSTPLGFALGSGGLVLSVMASCGATPLGCGYQHTNTFGNGIAAPVTAGSTYIIRVASITALFASFHLTVTPPGTPPPNDSCASATPVVNGVNGPFTNHNASPDGTASCLNVPFTVDRDVWFSYTATTTGTATFTTTPLALPVAYSAQVSVLSGCGGTELGCWLTSLSIAVTAGTNYRVRVSTDQNPSALTGFNLAITFAPPSLNDECTSATPLALGVNGPFTNAGATSSTGAPFNFVDTWYSFTTGSCPGSYTIEQCGVFTETRIYAACGGTPIPITGSGAACVGARVSILAAPFTTYRVAIGTAPGISTPYNLNVSQGTDGLLVFSSPLGPTSLQANLAGMPSSGLYFLPVTFNAGEFPYGPFFGLSMTLNELIAQFVAGFPFTGSVDVCGNLQIGPFGGLPSGLTLYAVALGFVGAYALPPAVVTSPESYTVP